MEETDIDGAADVGATLQRAGRLLRMRALQYLLVFGGGLVIARTLGPEGRGDYALPLTLATITWVALHLSLESAIGRLLARGEATPVQLTRLAVLAGLVLGSVGMLAAAGLGLATRDSLLGGASTAAILIAAATVGPSVFTQLFTVLLLRRGRVTVFGNAMAGLAVAQFLLLSGTALTGSLSPEVTLLINAAGTAGMAVVLGTVLARDLGPTCLVPSLPWRRSLRAVRLGLSLHPATVGAYLNLRIDLLLVAVVLDGGQAGLYSLAVVLAELVGIAARTIAQSALQGQTVLEEGAAIRFTLDFVRQTVAAAVGLAVVATALAYPLVVILYGDEWRDSVVPFVILLAAVPALTIEVPVRDLLIRVARPRDVSAVAFGAMLVNVGLNLLLLPEIGIAGAALASLVSYWLAAGMALGLLSRRTPDPVVASLLRPRPGDLAGSVLRRMTARTGGDGTALLALSATGLVVTFWSVPESTGPLTVGRAAMACSAVAVAVLVIRSRADGLRPPRVLVAFVLALTALVTLVVLSVTVGGGCQCAGSLAGLMEVSAVAILCAVLTGLRPAGTDTLLLAAAMGAALTAALALAGMNALGPAAGGDVAEGRLTGPVGNPNFLGFLLACALPLVVMAGGRPRWVRNAAGAAGIVLVVALLATFSRGALLGAVLGAIAGASATRVTRRGRVLVVIAGLTVCGGIGLAAYGAYDQLRSKANFTEARRQFSAVDRNGWDARALGPIPAGPGRMQNRAGALALTSGGAGQGMSRPLGPVPVGQPITVEFRARTDSAPLTIRYELKDYRRAGDAVVRTARLTRTWRRLKVVWTPRVPGQYVRFYVWRGEGRSSIELSRVMVRRGGGPPRAADLALQGSVVDRLQAAFDAKDTSFVQSRIDALDMAMDAFADDPVAGLGWQRFPDYARRRGEEDALNTHNEYSRMVAELGAGGGVALMAVLLVIGSAARRLPQGRLRVAAWASLTAGAVGLLFVNGLVTPTSTVPLAMVAGVVVGATPWRRAGP